MPKTISTTLDGQIIGGIFSNHENSVKAVAAFRELSIPNENIQVVIKRNDDQDQDTYTTTLLEHGFSHQQALYHNKVIREGKALVVVYEVTDPAPIIAIFDKFGAEYNPNGSRNLRDDVAGMTVGAVVGAAAGGVVGSLVGGPVGAMAGGAVGAVVGGGSGAAAGLAIEHNK